MLKSGRKVHDANNAKRLKVLKEKKISMTVSLFPGTESKLVAYASKKRRTRAGMARIIIEDFMKTNHPRPKT